MIRFRILIPILFFCLVIPLVSFSQEAGIKEILEKIHGVVSLEKMGDSLRPFYRISFLQPVDHSDEGQGFFQQKIHLQHNDFNSPVVFDTEGYVMRQFSVHELTGLLNGNQISVEHRFFGNSIPESHKIDWNSMDAWQASMDYHRIVYAFREIYTGKWIGTGISKGGQAAMLHRMYFPADVDITVAYVAPLNFSPEDKRVEKFLRTVGTPGCRKMIRQFQIVLLERKDEIMPYFRDYVRNRGFEFRVSLEEIYEYAVLEFPVSYWQWGLPCKGLPVYSQEPFQLFMFLASTGSIDFLSTHRENPYEPAFYQFFTELGFYGYSTRGIRKHLKEVRNPSLLFLAPEGADLRFKKETAKELDRFVRIQAERVILIYGENDPWSATAADPGRNDKVRRFIKPDGNHAARINNIPEFQRQQIIGLLMKWMEN